jgi:hypothetical protein
VVGRRRVASAVVRDDSEATQVFFRFVNNSSLRQLGFLNKSSLRQQTVANASAAMRIRNMGMLLNPSPCQFAAAAQHDDMIRSGADLTFATELAADW